VPEDVIRLTRLAEIFIAGHSFLPLSPNSPRSRPDPRNKSRNLRYGPRGARSHRIERDGQLPASSFLLPDGSAKALLAECGAVIDAGLRSSLIRSSFFRDTTADPTSLFMSSVQCAGRSSGRVPGQSLDTRENLPKERRRQVAFGQLQDEVPRVPNEAAAGLEQPLLQARQRPTLDGTGEGESAQEIPELGRDDPQEQPHLIGPEAVTGEPGPVRGLLAFLDPLLRRSTLVVEADDGPVRPRERRDDENPPGGTVRRGGARPWRSPAGAEPRTRPDIGCFGSGRAGRGSAGRGAG
jgi:hypothetical protein